MLRDGVKGLDRTTCWQQHYVLCLDLFTALAEMEVLCGTIRAAKDAIREVIDHGKSLEDKHRVYCTLLDLCTTSTEANLDEAVDRCLEILKMYGEKLPRRPSRARITLELSSLLNLLPKRRFEGLLELPEMVDESAWRKCNILTNHLAIAIGLLPGHDNLTLLAGIRALKTSCKYGICPETPLAILPIALAYRRQAKYTKACETANVAILLSDRFCDRPLLSEIAKVKAVAHGCVLLTLCPFHKSLDVFLGFHEVALQRGATKYSSISALIYCQCYFCVGLPLLPLKSDLASFEEEAQQFGLADVFQVTFRVLRETIGNLEETRDNPTNITGHPTVQEQFVKPLEDKAREKVLLEICIFRLMLACIYGDLDTAKEMLDVIGTPKTMDMPFPREYIRLTYTGLAAFMVGRQRSAKRYMGLGKKVLHRLEKYVKQRSVNVRPVVLMLEAEAGPTKEKYDKAIKACGRSGFMHHQAFMNERAGLFFLQQNDIEWAKTYLTRAVDLYTDWGALGKVARLRQAHAFVDAAPQLELSTSIKGRPRHKNTFASRIRTIKLFSSKKLGQELQREAQGRNGDERRYRGLDYSK